MDGEEQIKSGYLSNDTIIVNDKNTVKEFSFILVKESKIESPSNIGLMIPSAYTSIRDINFITQLKKLGFIQYYSFMINYTSSEKGEGEFIMGGPPHFFDKKYNKNYYKTEYAINKPRNMIYGLKFDSINYGNIDVNGKMEGKFLCDFGLIAGSTGFYKIINESFFEDKIKNNICFVNNIRYNLEWREGENNFEYFYCIKDKIDIKEFNNLKFVQKNLNFTFEFNYKDLFHEIDNYYIFKIIFHKYSNFYWIFGKPWLEKNLMIFDQDTKTIGNYYYIQYNNDDIIPNTNNDNSNMVFIIVIVILVIILIAFVGWLIYIFKKNDRKKRLNEINEEFDYNQENEKEENLTNDKLGLNK